LISLVTIRFSGRTCTLFS